MTTQKLGEKTKRRWVYKVRFLNFAVFRPTKMGQNDLPKHRFSSVATGGLFQIWLYRSLLRISIENGPIFEVFSRYLDNPSTKFSVFFFH